MIRTFYFIYLGLLIAFTFFSYVYIDANLTYFRNLFNVFHMQDRSLMTGIYVFLIILLFLIYFLVIRYQSTKRLNHIFFKLFIITPIVVLFFSYPAMLSYDIFNYIATAKILVLYNENPYVIMPIEFVGDPMLDFMHASNKTALYGPVWIVLSSIPIGIGLNNFTLTLFALKGFIATFYIASLFLIKNLGDKNSVLFFALNPLIIVETLVSSHNDIVMMFFALLSFYLLRKKKIIYAIIFLLLSILIKYATLVLIFPFLLVLFKMSKKKKINWKTIYILCGICLFLVFSFSFLREEIYPWYGIWFIVFFSIAGNRFLRETSIALSIGLLLRYVPFLATGLHDHWTPALKILLLWLPLLFFLLWKINNLWLNGLKTNFRF